MHFTVFQALMRERDKQNKTRQANTRDDPCLRSTYWDYKNTCWEKILSSAYWLSLYWTFTQGRVFRHRRWRSVVISYSSYGQWLQDYKLYLARFLCDFLFILLLIVLFLSLRTFDFFRLKVLILKMASSVVFFTVCLSLRVHPSGLSSFTVRSMAVMDLHSSILGR